MIRNVFITLIFFFGPALLMFVIRHIFLLMRVAWILRKQRHADDIIDITPRPTPNSPGKVFIMLSLLIGLACATLVWFDMDDSSHETMQYVPAHMDAHGKLIPGEYIPSPLSPAP